jgi:hypothetical protein
MVDSHQQNAASISSLLLTTDAIISEIKEDKPEPAGAGGGGMGGIHGSAALRGAVSSWDFHMTTQIISATETSCAHSGDLGDIIYSLPAIRAKGPRSFTLFPSRESSEIMTAQRAGAIIPLLQAQPYLKEIRYRSTAETSALDRSRLSYKLRRCCRDANRSAPASSGGSS